MSRLVRFVLVSALGMLAATAAAPPPALAQSGISFTLLKDVNPNVYKGIAAGSLPYGFTPAGRDTFFVAKDGVHHFQLWATNGTGAGTHMLTNDPRAQQGHRTTPPNNLTALGSQLIFNASPDQKHANQVWQSDGTLAGTGPLDPADPSLAAAAWITPFGSRIIFVAHDDAHGYQPWISDGTAAGTHILRIIDPLGETGSEAFVVMGSEVYFTAASNESESPQIWKTDGTSAGTTQVSHVAGLFPTTLTVANFAEGRALVFAGDDGNKVALWKTDGTSAGTKVLKYVGVYDMISAGPRVYFSGSDKTHGVEPWVSDGTSAGTGLVKNIYAGSRSSRPQNFVPMGGDALFTANPTAQGTNNSYLYLAGPKSGGGWRATKVGGSATKGAYGPAFIGDTLIVEVGAYSHNEKYDLVTGLPSNPSITRIQTIGGAAYQADLVEIGSNVAVNTVGGYAVTAAKIKGYGNEPIVARLGS